MVDINDIKIVKVELAGSKNTIRTFVKSTP
jgi:hypothetical protein